MADDRTRDELAQLRAELTADFAARLAAQAATLRAERRRQFRLPRRVLPLTLVALLVVLTPLALLAASPFNDLTGGVHDANIGLIYDAGITKGCVPNVSYCPTGNVTREEMASFLARTAGLGTNPPVVNAKAAQTATNADNANSVGGYAPNGLVRVARASVPSGSAILVTTAYPPPTPGEPDPASAYQPVLTLPITAPTAGFVYVTAATGAFRSDGGTGNLALFARLRLASDTSGTTASPRQVTYVPASGALIQSLTVTWVLPVGAGEQTIVLDVARFTLGPATGTMSAFDPTLTAIFVPFGHTGGAALGEGGAATGEPGGPASGTR